MIGVFALRKVAHLPLRPQRLVELRHDELRRRPVIHHVLVPVDDGGLLEGCEERVHLLVVFARRRQDGLGELHWGNRLGEGAGRAPVVGRWFLRHLIHIQHFLEEVNLIYQTGTSYFFLTACLQFFLAILFFSFP